MSRKNNTTSSPIPAPNAETATMDAGGSAPVIGPNDVDVRDVLPTSGWTGLMPRTSPDANMFRAGAECGAKKVRETTLSADAFLFGLFGLGARSADREASRSALIAALSQETGETPDIIGSRIPRDIGTLFTVLAHGVSPSDGGSWAAGAKDGETRGAKAIAMLRGGATAEKATNAYADIGTPVQGAARYLAARLAHGRVASVGDGAAREAGVKKVTSYAASPTRDV